MGADLLCCNTGSFAPSPRKRGIHCPLLPGLAFLASLARTLFRVATLPMRQHTKDGLSKKWTKHFFRVMLKNPFRE